MKFFYCELCAYCGEKEILDQSPFLLKFVIQFQFSETYFPDYIFYLNHLHLYPGCSETNFFSQNNPCRERSRKYEG